MWILGLKGLNPHVHLFLLLFFSLGGGIRVKMEKPSSVIDININISCFFLLLTDSRNLQPT